MEEKVRLHGLNLGASSQFSEAKPVRLSSPPKSRTDLRQPKPTTDRQRPKAQRDHSSPDFSPGLSGAGVNCQWERKRSRCQLSLRWASQSLSQSLPFFL